MAATAIFGINSNLDTEDIINKLVSLQARPIDLVEAKRIIEEQRLASFRELKSRLQTFKSVVTTLNTESRFIVNKGEFSNNSSSDSNRVVDITTTSSATSGSFSLTVNNLATGTKIITEGFASATTTLNTGNIKITVGSTTKTITLDSTNNTLGGLRLAINNLGLDIKASFLNTGSTNNPIRLLISGTKTGSDNGVSIDNSISGIGIGILTPITFTQTQSAQNANFVVDGVSITKASNTITDVIAGAALKLESAGSGTVSLSTDIDTITTKISDFVAEYNELVLFLNEQLNINPSSKETGVLFGNFAAQSLQQTLRESISGEVQGITSTFTFLSQIGITTEVDGTLIIDTNVLADAMTKDITNVSQLFSSKGTTTDSRVAFVGFTNDTRPGSYDLRVSGGVPQLATSGTTSFSDTTGSGNFFAGAEGNNEEGLNFRISSLIDGSFGTITLSIGIAEVLNRKLTDLTDASLNGPLETEIDTITESIAEFDDTIEDLTQRLVLFEENLKGRFTNLEIVLGRLNSQKDVFNNSIDGLKNLFIKR